jgi:hypothetical protein
MSLDGAWREERRARLQRFGKATLVVHGITVVYSIVHYAVSSSPDGDPGVVADEAVSLDGVLLVVATGLGGVWESQRTVSRLRRGVSTVIEERWLVARNRVLLMGQCCLVLVYVL